jgi:hypothetical protein
MLPSLCPSLRALPSLQSLLFPTVLFLLDSDDLQLSCKIAMLDSPNIVWSAGLQDSHGLASPCFSYIVFIFMCVVLERPVRDIPPIAQLLIELHGILCCNSPQQSTPARNAASMIVKDTACHASAEEGWTVANDNEIVYLVAPLTCNVLQRRRNFLLHARVDVLRERCVSCQCGCHPAMW